MAKRMKYPVGLQSFEGLIRDGFVYVDKTDLMCQIIDSGKYNFLSRPRRFGKSLLLSTMKAYFEGKRDLFKGLAVERLHEGEWVERPVLHIDFNAQNYNCVEVLQKKLDSSLREWEILYGGSGDGDTISTRFANVIRRAHEQSKHRVAILIDEYDKPMTDNIDKPELQEAMRAELRGLYGVMKSEDEHIRFGFLTGVTKFGKLSVFSGLNNISDISLNADYATICGLTEQEIHDHFDEGVGVLAEAVEMSKEECYAELAKRYDGYHFAKRGQGVYNPYSLLRTLADKDFGDYWFGTGTPTMLVRLLRDNRYDIRQLDGCSATGEELGSIETMRVNPLPLIFQSGYLTIKGYDRELDVYRLGFPNEEVERGFARLSLMCYVEKEGSAFCIPQFVMEVRDGKPEDFMRRLQAFTAGTSYEVVGEMELYVQNVLYLFFKLMGFYTEVESHTSDGRMDMVVRTRDYIYIFEFKIGQTAEDALRQIEEKGYALPYAADPRRLYRIGVSFSKETRRIEEYRIE